MGALQHTKRPFVSISAAGDMPSASNKQRNLRGFALVVVVLSAALAGYTVWILARPLYWRFYAEVIHRYETDAAQQLIKELQKETGACGSCCASVRRGRWATAVV